MVAFKTRGLLDTKTLEFQSHRLKVMRVKVALRGNLPASGWKRTISDSAVAYFLGRSKGYGRNTEKGKKKINCKMRRNMKSDREKKITIA